MTMLPYEKVKHLPARYVTVDKLLELCTRASFAVVVRTPECPPLDTIGVYRGKRIVVLPFGPRALPDPEE